MPKLWRPARRSGFETMQIMAHGRTNSREFRHGIGDFEHDRQRKMALLVCRMAPGRCGAVCDNLGAIHFLAARRATVLNISIVFAYERLLNQRNLVVVRRHRSSRPIYNFN